MFAVPSSQRRYGDGVSHSATDDGKEVIWAVRRCTLTVREALSDGGSWVRVRATLPLDVSLLDRSQETVVALISDTWITAKEGGE